MMKICSHVVAFDTGLAPNPFHGYCTEAVCTPSHGRARLLEGDWLVGHSRKNEGSHLIYAMRIAEVLPMERYFADPRFAAKKPNPHGGLEEQCGDNFYFKKNGEWHRLPSRFHNSCASFNKDLNYRATESTFSGAKVFIAEHFYYFGANAVVIPQELSGIIKGSQGFKYVHPPLAANFLEWLERLHQPGIHGHPRDQADKSNEMEPMLTHYQADCEAQAAEPPQTPQPWVKTPRGCR